jgi:tRNA (cmo5U34)-methyltransferase
MSPSSSERTSPDLHDRLVARGGSQIKATGNGVVSEPTDPFSDPQAVARYTEGPPRIVPGYDGMQRMTTLLLAERVREDARVLVLGAGGGLELKAFAQAHPGWIFDGVEPASEMLKLAERILGPLASRATLHRGSQRG